MESGKARIRVYTRAVSDEDYPAGLARSVHIAVDADGTGFRPLNRNCGILFAEGAVSPENTIVPKGVRDPAVFAFGDGNIGIAAERVLENGAEDETCRGKVLLWKTRDLIRFEAMGPADPETLPLLCRSDTLNVDGDLAAEAARYWNAVVYTGVKAPEEIRVSTERDLDETRAVIAYSDGSERKKKIAWDKSTIRFDRPGRYRAEGEIVQQSFRFPLAKGYGDPVLFPWEGKWYYLSTNDNLNDIGIWMREAQTPEGLFAEGVTEHLILPFSPERGFEQTFWAPEFHVIGGELYILFAVSGHKWGPQCHVMKRRKTGKMTDEAGWDEPVRVVKRDGRPLAEEAITLDMTFIGAKSGAYMVWSYREHIGTPMDSGSMLYIASVDENAPWQLTSDPVLLTRPLLGWENVAGTINNEGPHAFIRGGKVYLTYSGGSANSYTYALGLLTAGEDSDFLDPGSWTKSGVPVLTFYSVPGEYGPGHNSFFVNDEGEMMIAYHAETGLKETLRCDGIRRVHFRKDGEPYFQMSREEDIVRERVTAEIVVEGDGT